MKHFLILLLPITVGIANAQTNSPSTNSTPSTNHIVKVSRNPPAIQSGLPADVAQADAKVVALYNQKSSLLRQIVTLQNKQNERAAAHLGPDPVSNMQISQLNTQANMISQQIITAERWDYQVRDLHHLPRFDARKVR